MIFLLTVPGLAIVIGLAMLAVEAMIRLEKADLGYTRRWRIAAFVAGSLSVIALARITSELVKATLFGDGAVSLAVPVGFVILWCLALVYREARLSRQQ